MLGWLRVCGGIVCGRGEWYVSGGFEKRYDL